MTLTFASGPANGASLVQAELELLTAGEAKAPTPLRRVPPATLTVQAPHALYDLWAQLVADGGGLESATQTGFRYLVNGPPGPMAAAEVHLDANGQANVASMNYGSFVAATASAFRQLRELPQVRAGNFEAAFLRFSAVSTMSIWLRAADTSGSLIYPLAPAPPLFHAAVLYPALDFMNLVRPLAKAKVDQKDHRKTP